MAVVLRRPTETVRQTEQRLAPQKSFADFLRACKRHDGERIEKVYETGWQSAAVEKAAMGESSGAVGGYLIPQEYSAAMMRTVGERSFIYPRAFKIPMGTSETLCPMVDAETALSAGKPPYFGGVFFTWQTASGATLTETEPKFRQRSMRAWNLTGYAVASNQWLADMGPGADQYFVELLGKAAAWQFEYAALQGIGAANLMPLGVVNAPGALLVSRGGGGTIAAQDIANMAGKMLPYGWESAVWACHPKCLTKIVSLSSFYLNDGAYEKEPGSYAGRLVTRPLFITDKLPALGTTGDLVFFDPSLYAVGVRQEVLVDVSDQGGGFPTNQSYVRVWLRIDGKPMLGGAVTLADGSETGSPYIILN